MIIPKGYVETSPGIWSHPSRVSGGVEARQPEPHQGSALVRNAQAPQGSGKGLGASRVEPDRSGRTKITVSLHARLRREFDEHDNLRASLKPLVDAVAGSLGVPDNHPGITWEYGQSVSRMAPCVVVAMEVEE